MYIKTSLIICVALLPGIVNNGVFCLKTYDLEWTNSITVDETARGSSSSSGILKSHTVAFYDGGKSKTVIITSRSYSDVILASIRRLDLRPSCADSLTLYDASSVSLVQPVKYCNVGIWRNDSVDIRESKVFFSGSNKLGITFDTAPGISSPYGGFELTFTAVSSWPCGFNQYQCDNYRCISKILKCDTHNHCGDYSDNKYCSTPKPYKPPITNYDPKSRRLTGPHIGIICGVVFLVIAISCGVYIAVRRSQTTRREARVIHPPPTVYQPQQPAYEPPPVYQPQQPAYPPPPVYQPQQPTYPPPYPQ